jgi:hypothetical protein
MKQSIELAVIVSFVALLCSVVRGDENIIFTELVHKGVPLSNGDTIKLPDPVMADGLNEVTQLKVMTGLTDSKHLESFLKGGLSDRYELKKSKMPGAKKEDSIGRQIDLYFVAEGKLDKAADSTFMKKLLTQNAPNPKGKAEFYTDKELTARQLAVADTGKMKEQYAHAFNNILGKVEVRGSSREIKTIEPESVIVASKLDPRFASDAKYPNQWQSIEVVKGRAQKADPETYSGLGGYTKITKLIGPVERVFVEYHLVFDEPHGWFKGEPNLVLHLDDVYKKDVRKFRRDLQQ